MPTADLNNLNIKSEPTYNIKIFSAEQISAYNPDYEAQFDHSNQEFLQETPCDSDYCDTYFNRNKENKYNRKSKTYPNTNARQLQCPFTQQSPQNPNWRPHKQGNIRKLPIKRGKNPLDRYGNPTKCAICHSINHWAQNCPDRESKNTYVVNEVVLHQSDYDNPNELKHLTSETWSSALLDCGASKTVCGKEWLTQYINNLSDTNQSKVLFGESNHIYRFGDGRKVNALHSVKICATIGTHNLEIKTDVVDNDIPLLF